MTRTERVSELEIFSAPLSSRARFLLATASRKTTIGIRKEIGDAEAEAKASETCDVKNRIINVNYKIQSIYKNISKIREITTCDHGNVPSYAAR